MKRLALAWLCFGLGWLGVFVPGLPTTIFWIAAALVFVRGDPRMYQRIVSDRRFGPAVRLFVEEGRISRKGKLVSIGAMLGFSVLGAFAIPPVWLKFLVLGSAIAGSLWVALIPEGRKPPAPADSPEGPEAAPRACGERGSDPD